MSNAENQKLLVLARSVYGRTKARQTAAIRDETGRTYAAAEIDLPSLQLSPISVAVAMAKSSAATGIEAVVIFGAEEVSLADRQILQEFTNGYLPEIFVATGQTLVPVP